MKNWIGLLLLWSCAFLLSAAERNAGGRGDSQQIWRGQKTTGGLSPHYRAGLEVGCKADRTRQDSALPILADCGESVSRQSSRHENPHQKAVAEVSLKE